MNLFYDPRCLEFGSPNHPEQSARVSRTMAYLENSHPDWNWVTPREVTEQEILRVHSPELLKRLQAQEDFDADTPWYAGIDGHARRAAGAAIGAVDAVLDGFGPAMAMMRPPGHHATTSNAMGFCYLNNMAIAVMHAKMVRGIDRIAVWDFDAHHGNGTEEILLNREGILIASVHQYPGYPESGMMSRGNSRNWPIPPGAHHAEHMNALKRSLECVKEFNPDLVLVSAGFDAYHGDPLANLTLKTADFAELGDWLKSTQLPAAAILEGGYSNHLPQLVGAFLTDWDS